MEDGRGMLEGGTTTVAPSNLCVLVSMVGGLCVLLSNWRWHSHNRHLEPGVCAYVNAWRWCNHNLHLAMCVSPVNALRWHSDNLHPELCVCFCQCFPHLETCVLMSMLGGGTATISMYS